MASPSLFRARQSWQSSSAVDSSRRPLQPVRTHFDLRNHENVFERQKFVVGALGTNASRCLNETFCEYHAVGGAVSNEKAIRLKAASPSPGADCGVTFPCVCIERAHA